MTLSTYCFNTTFQVRIRMSNLLIKSKSGEQKNEAQKNKSGRLKLRRNNLPVGKLHNNPDDQSHNLLRLRVYPRCEPQ